MAANETVMTQSSEYDRDEELATIEMVTLAIMLIVTVTGNSIVLIALYARRQYGGRKKLSRMYYFIFHLCVADLINAILNTFPQFMWEITYRFKGGPFLCKMVKFGQTLGPYLSSYILVATAIDRYKAVCHPLTYCSWTSRRSRIMVWIAWAVSLTFCTPQVTIFSYQEIAPGVLDCWATFPEPWGQRIYVTWYSISVFIAPLGVLVYTYSCICVELWRNSGFPESSSLPHRLISRAKINTVKQTVAVIVLYVGCSSPFICAQLWASWDPDAGSSPFWQGATFTILMLLSSLNSCVNPWIYLSFNRDLFRAVQYVFSCSWTMSEYRTNNSGGSGSSGCGPSACKRVITEVTNTLTLVPNNPEMKRWVVSAPGNCSSERGGAGGHEPTTTTGNFNRRNRHYKARYKAKRCTMVL